MKEHSRTTFRKVQDIELLRKLLDQHDLYSMVPDRESLWIDNTNISPDVAAEKIIEHFGLEPNASGMRTF